MNITVDSLRNIWLRAKKSEGKKEGKERIAYFPKSFFSFPFLNEKKGQILEFELKNLL